MRYIILFVLFALTVFLHWHYYRWCIFNMKINRPKIYWSHKGDLLVHGSAMVLFVAIIFLSKWYLIIIPLILFQVMKLIARNQELNNLVDEFVSQDHQSKTKALELAKQTMDHYND
ncbi:MAG: hypothetical protein BWY19_01120 [bacterium ADurb.Bin212]|nr:MAG: hypothetical protein BWY19_01120 [bacterium ADurb.Bin212]